MQIAEISFQKGFQVLEMSIADKSNTAPPGLPAGAVADRG
jgi:hypothetical protein